MTQLALVIDLNVCVGCHACVTSCKQWNTSGEAGYLSDDNPYGAEPTGTFFNQLKPWKAQAQAYDAEAREKLRVLSERLVAEK